MKSRLFHSIVVLGTSLATACGGSDSTGTTPPGDAASDANKDAIGSDSSAETADTFPTIKPSSDTGSDDTSGGGDTTGSDSGTDTFPGIKPPPPPDDAFPSIK